MQSGSESRTDDSQASEFLAAALRPRDLHPPLPLATAPDYSRVQESPLLSDSNNSVHYHLHGLAPTQSVSGSQDQPCTQGSQKENAPASSDKHKLPNPSPPPSPSRLQPPSYTSELTHTPSNIFPLAKTAKDKRCPKDLVPTNALSSPPKPGKAISSPSPSRPPSKPQSHSDRPSALPSRSMPPPPRPRSLSPMSQDSFAGPLPEPDYAKIYLESTRNFNVPLSQVGQPSQSQSEEEGPPPVSSNFWSSPQPSPPRKPSPPPRILVAGTPSDSSRASGSQHPSQSQPHAEPSLSQHVDSHYPDSQSSDLFPQAQARTDDYPASQPIDDGRGSLYASSQRSPSLDDDFFGDMPVPTPVPTQPVDDITPPTQIVEQTQLSAQADIIASIARDHHYFNENSQMVFPTVQSDAHSTNTSRSALPRRLLGLVPPEKRYRYNGVASEAAGPSKSNVPPVPTDWDIEPANDTQPSDAHSSDGIHTQDTQLTDEQDAVEETQPSDVAVNGSIASLLPPRRRLPPANYVLQSGRSLPLHADPAAAKVPEFDASFDPDETGPTQIVTPSPEQKKMGLRQILSPSPDETGPTQIVSQSPDKTGPTQIASQFLEQSSPTKIVPDSDPPDPQPGPATASSRRRRPSVSSVETYHSPAESARVRTFMQSEDEVLRTIAATEPSVPPIAEEEEEEEEEEVPLAQKFPSAKAKGKQKATEPSGKSPAVTRGRGGKGLQSPMRPAIARGNTHGSWKGVVIPSSDPGERQQEAAAPKATASKSTKPHTPVNQVPPPAPQTRSARAAKTAARGRLAESSDEEDEDEDRSSLTDVATVRDADDEEMDVDPPDARAKPARGNKRKRAVSGSAKKANGRTVIKEESSTPLGRPAKRIKVESADAPTRVFALWKGSAKYFTGVVYQSTGHSTRKYIVKFDDNDSAELNIRHMRACRLKPGDHVLLRELEKAVVVEYPPCPDGGCGPEDIVTIKLKDDRQEEVQAQDLQIALRTVTAEWNDRVLTDDTIIPIIRPKASPTPSRQSVSVQSEGAGVSRKRPLMGVGLVVSLAPSKEVQDPRPGIVAEIKKCGGVVLDDWTTIFGMEGTLEHKNQRWMLKVGDIQWKQKGGQSIDKIFLLSDDFHQKPKYLVALALGIPCLSVEWVKARAEQGAEWRSHLLPAGYSEQLEARVSQMVDVDWGSSDHHLTDVAANKVAAKVFADASVLCVSPDFVPSKKSKKSGDGAQKKEAAESVPRIVLCMGAATVESVADVKHASQAPKAYDYIVVPAPDLSEFSRYKNVVDVNWVKDCLISGRILPMPD